MCGLISVLNFDSHEFQTESLKALSSSLRHRGPDSEGFALFTSKESRFKLLGGKDTPQNIFQAEGPYFPKEVIANESTLPDFDLALIHRRLSIVDLSVKGHQPLSTQDGRYWIVYNGEIYNHEDLRSELEGLGFSFFSRSDTEMILNAWIAWGDDCVRRFNGMWAFAIWDNREKEFFISRDRLGIKPLYYFLDHYRFILSSEIKPIYKLVKPKENRLEIASFLLDGPNEAQSYTEFEGVKRFPKSSSTRVNIDKLRQGNFLPRQYWDIAIDKNATKAKFSESQLKSHSEKYFDLLKDSIRLRLPTEVKMGSALSGGLDSSSLVYLVSQVFKEKNISDKQMTFSCTFSDPRFAYCDESRFINLLTSQLDLDPRSTSIETDQIVESYRFISYQYESLRSGTCLSGPPVYKLAQTSGVKVTLDGQGADELLAGYLDIFRPHFLKGKLWLDFKHVRAHGVSQIRTFLRLMKSKLNSQRTLRQREFLQDLLEGVVGVEKTAFSDYLQERKQGDIGPDDNLSIALKKYCLFNLSNLLHYGDRASMSYSVESRVPFLDFRLVEFLFTVPDVYKIRAGWSKYLARVAFDKRLPSEIVWRKDKMGWPSPDRELVLSDHRKSFDKIIADSGLPSRLPSSNISYYRILNTAFLMHLFFGEK